MSVVVESFSVRYMPDGEHAYLTVMGEGFYRSFRVRTEQVDVPDVELKSLIQQLLSQPRLKTGIDR